MLCLVDLFVLYAALLVNGSCFKKEKLASNRVLSFGMRPNMEHSQKRSLDPVNAYLSCYINGQISSSTCAVGKKISMVLLE